MKKILLSSFAIVSIAILFTTSQTSCKKESVITDTDTVYKCTPNIQGLWVGTYTVGAGFPVPAGTSFFFSFSIHPDGKMSYKAKGFYNGSYEYITFADGTWALNGAAFTFSVTTVNLAGGGPQLTQTGTATYNSANGTLTNGIITNGPGSTETFTMAEVN